MSHRVKLTKAVSNGSLVRVYREGVEPGWADGYVEVVGRDWFALSLVGEGVHFNGFNCFRVKDVSKVSAPAPHADFIEAALKKRGEKRKRFKSLDATSLPSLMRTAMKKYPLLTVYLDADQEDCCYIGRVLTVGDIQVNA